MPFRVRLLLLAALVAAPPPGGAQPDTGADRLQLVQERRAALENEVRKLRGQEKTLLGQVERLDLEVALRTEQLREAELLLRRTNEELDGIIARSGRLETEVERLRPQLRQRARSLYQLGELSYLRLLLSVEDASDLFRGYHHVTTLARRDQERVVAFRSALSELRTTRSALEDRTREALRQRSELEQARRRLDAERRKKSDLLTRLVQRKETQAALLAELQDAEEQLGRLVAGLATGDVSVPIAALRGNLPWPVTGRIRTGFGRQHHPRFATVTVQNGIDVAAPEGTPVFAVHEGTVAFADRFRGYGTMVVLDHGGKHHTLYAHLDRLEVETGQRIAAGQLIGTTGATGLDGAGLYFEVRFQGRPEDPQQWLAPR